MLQMRAAEFLEEAITSSEAKRESCWIGKARCGYPVPLIASRLISSHYLLKPWDFEERLYRLTICYDWLSSFRPFTGIRVVGS